MKVLLRAPLSTFTGYGNDGIGLAQALIRRGADVYLQPAHVDAPLPKDIAELLMKPVQGPFDLFIDHEDPAQLEARPEVTALCGVSIAWSMWEYSNFGNLPKKHRKTLRKRMENFDAYIGYSNVDRCMDEYYDGPIVIQQGGYNPEGWERIERNWHEENFYFFMIGVLSTRKDPFKAIQAFVELQREHEDFRRYARLSLKTTAPGLHSKMEDVYPGLRIYYDVWPTDVVKAFYRDQHVLLAPSRGEGKNMPALEFMTTGGTVIATDWAGHKEWLSPAYAYPLNYTLESVDEEHPETLNARADVEHLKELMLHVFRNRNEAREKGKLAADIIPKAHSWDRVLDKLFEKIRESVPEKGERLYTLAQMAIREAPHVHE